MEMKTVNVLQLEGEALDWAVAKAEDIADCIVITRGSKTLWLDHENYRPSFNWLHGGDLMQIYRIEILHGDDTVFAKVYGEKNSASSGSTPLIAACRAIVTHKLGDTVQVPVELLNQQ